MRILFIITNLGRGGAERFVVDIVEHLTTYRGVTCKIAYLMGPNLFKEYEDRVDFEFVDYKPARLREKNWTPRFHQIVADFRPDIIHTNLFLAEFISSECIYDVQYVCHGHDNMIQFKKFTCYDLLSKVSLLNRIERNILFKRKYSLVRTHFIANSRDTYRYYSEVLPARYRASLRILPYPVNRAKFRKAKGARINSTTFKLVNVASFQAKKDQSFLLDVMVEIIKRDSNIRLDFVGGGDLIDYVKARAKTLNLEDFVSFHGVVDNVEQIMSESDLYVHGAWYEPFGIVFIEAMSVGLPIVAINGRGNTDIIENGTNGYIVERGNAKLFAEHIIRIKNNNSEYLELSSSAYEGSRKYDIKRVGSSYYDFYKEILG